MDTNHALYKEYELFCSIPSDINEHMPILYELALKCNHTTELGVGYGRSTRSFIAALIETAGIHHSYEIKLLEGVSELFARATTSGLAAWLHLKSTLDEPIQQTDMLLVDSHHTYIQVKAELELHGDKVNKYICFHDTVLYGDEGQDPGSLGIRPAIDEWMQIHPEWIILEERLINNGMLILEKVEV